MTRICAATASLVDIEVETVRTDAVQAFLKRVENAAEEVRSILRRIWP